MGLAGARLRAAALERRLVPDLAAVLRAAGLAAALRVDAEEELELAAERFDALFFAGDLRAVLPRAAAGLPPELEPPLDVPRSSSIHLPDITRWAASATASAISEPSLEALLIIVEAALLALSAASRPASRIARRALGLAAIAAAAAVSPAASISRLIAALAILSIVLFEAFPPINETGLILLPDGVLLLQLDCERHVPP